MIPVPLAPTVTKKGDHQSTFEIQGLYPGYGVTVGNALRRVLLSSMEGVAVIEAKIKGAPHEFSTVPGILEDTIMVLLNLKNLRFKIHDGEMHKLELLVKGEKKVTGADIALPSQVTLANPQLHIATITDKKSELSIELTIQRGIGYEPRDQRKVKNTEIGAIALDAIFTPIKNVNFNVENMRVGDRTDFDKLSLQIETDGTVTPEQVFFDACDLLLKHFTILSEGKEAAKVSEAAAVDNSEDATKTRVEDMKVSTRTLNALTENSIKTVGGLIKKSEKSLSEMEGMGDKAIQEIKKALKKLGLELKPGE